jgi:molybdopterin synthase catalytic subunit
MDTTIRLTHGALTPAAATAHPPGGAVVQFLGVVRPEEDGKQLVALDYEVYEPMTTKELDRLAHGVAEELGVQAISVEHSVGRVPVGGISFRLTVVAGHRAAALTACGTFIDRMKRDIPLWKVPVWAESTPT